jgi:ATP-binding cassette subfamily F protein 3
MQREFEANKMRREHVQKFIDRFRVNANRAAQVQSRIKALQRMDALVEIVEDEHVELRFPQPERLDGNLIGCRDVCFSYDEKAARTNPLLKNVNCAIDMDSRVGILGTNGNYLHTFIF